MTLGALTFHQSISRPPKNEVIAPTGFRTHNAWRRRRRGKTCRSALEKVESWPASRKPAQQRGAESGGFLEEVWLLQEPSDIEHSQNCVIYCF